MCLIVFDWSPQAPVLLRLAANRDERHARPSAPLDHWQDAPGIVGGRDLQAGGTWMAMHTTGRFAAVTNVRDPAFDAPAAGPSRGQLVRQALESPSLPDWLERLVARDAAAYAGFNLLAGDGETLWHVHHGRHGTHWQGVAPGLHGVSNATLDTPWPKLVHSRHRLGEVRGAARQTFQHAAWALLADDRPAADAQLPDTGIGLERERLLSAPFIVGSDYGTRASTLLEWRADGEVTLAERRFGPEGVFEAENRLTLEVPARPTR
ncbi:MULTISPECIES: NRDE family protein [unclassified Modicisalibacter]|uniref:NRDE family protein n=1 Tax=unclassified Modicisalibacter TaxID=2679913 RepID=UPI001CCB085B|nr:MULTISPECIES: NRDE family protein [unclassified Modicisalibacter]MBZ9557517.1 NRDE family protein [Modicisalibacter sp. R2A 31.J]MBZ9573818.1 NRDE family protein [Modicisalibacter sp. MOD 31.J]